MLKKFISVVKKGGRQFAKVTRRHPVMTVLIALALAIGVWLSLVIWQIGHFSLWFDESFSRFMMNFNLAEITHYTAIDVHPPLYYYLLKGWTSVFGLSDIALRAFSAACGVIVIILGFFLTRKIGGHAAGWVALPLLVLSPYLLSYGLETRMYTLVMIFAFSSTLALLKMRENPRGRWWILYGILAAAGMWTHYFMALVIAAQWVWWICAHVRQNPALKLADKTAKTAKKPLLKVNKKVAQSATKLESNLAAPSRGARLKTHLKQIFLPNFWKSGVLMIVLYLPWLPFMWEQFRSIQNGFWIPPLSANTLPDYLSNVLLYRGTGEVTGWLAVLFFAVVIGLAVLLWQAWRETAGNAREKLMLLISLISVPIIALIILSLPPFKPAFIDRYIISSSLAIVTLAAVLLVFAWQQRRRLIAVGLFILLSLTLLIGVLHYNVRGNDHPFNFRTVATQLNQISNQNEPLVVSGVSPFYNIASYETGKHPARILSETVENWGSSQMVRDMPRYILKQIPAGTKLWYLNQSDEPLKSAPRKNWREICTVKLDDNPGWLIEYQVE
jgi:hypothetical protein